MIDIVEHLKNKHSAKKFWDCMQTILEEIQDLHPNLAKDYSRKKMITALNRFLFQLRKLLEANYNFIPDIEELIKMIEKNLNEEDQG